MSIESASAQSGALPNDIPQTVRLALAEDIGSGDVTASLIPDGPATAQVITREPATLCGCAWFDEVFHQLDPSVQVDWQAGDGARVRKDQLLCQLRGPARVLLTGERTALNFLQLLSGVATQTRVLADRIKDTHARILDTRKTLPLLRSAQKYAVTCGGGVNHRFGLYDAILIKENHIAAAGSVAAAVRAALAQHPEVPLIVEVENIRQLEEAFNAGAPRALLDNFPEHMLAKATVLARQLRKMNMGPCLLEASGNVTLNSIREIADTGVDYISVGGLTKHITAVDLSMRLACQN